MQNSRILLLAKTSLWYMHLGNDQAADMLQNNIILLLMLELISKEDADKSCNTYWKVKDMKEQSSS